MKFRFTMLFTMAVALSAQRITDTRTASMRGGGNGDLRLFNCRVSINRRGSVDVSFDTDSNSRIAFVGRVQRMDRGRIIADMNGNNIGGQMEIEVDSRNRVRSIFMEKQNGRDRYELNWRN